MPNGFNVGEAILNFARSFTAMRQQKRAMDMQQQRLVLDQQEMFQRAALKEQDFALREQMIQRKIEDADLKRQISDQQIELNKLKIAGAQQELAGGPRKETLGEIGKAIDDLISEANTLVRAEKGSDTASIIQAALTGTVAPKSKDPQNQQRLEQVFKQLQFFKSRRDKLLGLDVVEPVETPNVNQTGTPQKPLPSESTITPGKPAEQPRGQRMDAVIRQQTDLMTIPTSQETVSMLSQKSAVLKRKETG
jgi:hypothetical protein